METYLAQFNVAPLRYPLTDSRMKEFVDNIDLVHRIADRVGGLIRRVQDESGNALHIPVLNNPNLVPNLTVWKDWQSLKTFVFKTMHKKFFDNREKWFSEYARPKNVMWFVAENEVPALTMQEGEQRILHLEKYGPTQYAFDWKYLENETVHG